MNLVLSNNASLNNLSKIEKMEKGLNNKCSPCLKRHRVIVILNFIKDIPETINKNLSYFLEYNFFDQQIKYKLDLNNLFQKNNSQCIPLNKIKLFYFFSEDRKGVNNFLKLQNVNFPNSLFFQFF